MASRRLSIRIGPDLEREIRERARVSRKRASDIVRDLLQRDLVGTSPALSCYDVAHKARAIGCAEGAPRDLSTNPRHLEGFGGR